MLHVTGNVGIYKIKFVGLPFVFRLAVSSKGILAAPLDNRDVRLWDVTGTRLVSSKRTRRQVMNFRVGAYE
jgi:hypothetical protein